MISDNRVLFLRVAITLNCLDIKTVVASWHIVVEMARLMLQKPLGRFC